MASTRATRFPSRLRSAFAGGTLCAMGLIGYGRMLVPGTNPLSIAAAVFIITLYTIVGWFAPWTIHDEWPAILPISALFGILAGTIFVAEIVLEYILLPADNARMGLFEFGLVLVIYTSAGVFGANRYRSVTAGTIAAVATAMISSLIWFIAVLITFYCFYGSPRQELVLQAEGNYDDFARSGMADFRTFVMEDFFGAGFYHLLLAPLIATALGAFAGCIAVIAGRTRRS